MTIRKKFKEIKFKNKNFKNIKYSYIKNNKNNLYLLYIIDKFIYNYIIKNKIFIICITGNISIGKTTTAYILKKLLNKIFINYNIQIISTDNFLYPNKILKKFNIIKGFPNSYKNKKIINIFKKINNSNFNKINIKIPIYSHQIYDIIPNNFQIIKNPNILIIEGINILQIKKIYKFINLSIFLNSNIILTKKWFKLKIKNFIKKNKNNPKSFYFYFKNINKNKINNFINNIWKKINLKNFRNFISKTKYKANIILNKTKKHKFNKILIKKN